MKKFISMLLIIAMIVSLAAVVSLPTAAVDGEWIAYSSAGEYRDDFEGDPSSLIGYEYTRDGLRIIPADWKDSSPVGGIQTKTAYDVKEGVYMLVRIDEFAWDAGDKWFNLNLWSQEMVSPGSNDVDKFGFGLQTLVRTDANGNIHTLWWHTGGFDVGAQSTVKGTSPKDENGKLLLELTVTWDGTTFAADINGWEAPESVVKYMNETFVDMDAFVGFNFLAAKKAGTAGMTVLKFGTSKETAITPSGDDSREPINYYHEVAEIADPNTVEEGQPGVLLNGSRDFSDAKTNTGISGSIYRTRNEEDYSVRYFTDKPYVNATYSVANDVSYDIDDFPVVIVLTRNLCTCEEENGEVECWAMEEAWMYLATGDAAIDDDHMAMLETVYDPIIDDEGNSYLYFFYDMSAEDAAWDAEGRIKSVRADFKNIYYNEPDRSSFDLCFIAFFRNMEDAEAYIYNYIGELYGEDTTEEPTEVTTEAPATTATPETTVAPEGTTAAPEQTTAAPKADDEKGGCGSAVGFGAIAIVALTSVAGFVSFKKKED